MIKERWSSVSRKDMTSERRKQDLNICLPLLNIFRQLILMTEEKKCYELINLNIPRFSEHSLYNDYYSFASALES